MTINQQNKIFIFIYPQDSPVSPEDRVKESAAIFTNRNVIHGAVPAEKLFITKDKLGKPHFQNESKLHFSITHSGDYWACAFDTEPIGIDLQQHVSCRCSHISKRFFHQEEHKYLIEQNHLEDFFTVWAAKESFVKFTGSGILNAFENFSVTGTEGLLEETKDNGHQGILTLVPFKENYSMCVCSQYKKEIVLQAIPSHLLRKKS